MPKKKLKLDDELEEVQDDKVTDTLDGFPPIVTRLDPLKESIVILSRAAAALQGIKPNNLKKI